MIKVNIGCGEFPARGWINVDIARNDQVQPDMTADARDLPFGDGTVDVLYLGHVLEHLAEPDVVVALRECRRVIKSTTGVMCVVVPCLDLAEQFHPQAVDDILNGGHRWPGDEHQWVSRASAYPPMLSAADWRASAVPITDVGPEWPVVSRIGWQAAFVCTPRVMAGAR